MEYDLEQSENFEKKRVLLEDVNQLLVESFQIHRKIRNLNNEFLSKINEIQSVSKEIKAEAVTKTLFSRKILKLRKLSNLNYKRLKYSFNQKKRQFAQILTNVGKNIMKEVFLCDKVHTLSKGDFRRYIGGKVKNFLGSEYVDFDNNAHIHFFERMKRSLDNDPVLNKRPYEIKSNLLNYQEEERDIGKVESMKLMNNFIIGNNLRRIKRLNHLKKVNPVTKNHLQEENDIPFTNHLEEDIVYESQVIELDPIRKIMDLIRTYVNYNIMIAEVHW